MKRNLLFLSSYRTHLALLCIAGMIAGFVAGWPAMLSISMMLLGAAGLWGHHPKEWLKQHWWLLGLPWVLLYVLSWFWSANKDVWATLVQIKMPFLLLPLAFSLLPPFSARQHRWFTALLFLSLMAGMSYSIIAFSENAPGYIADYKYARLIPAPADGDHIRFSMLAALSFCWGVYIWPSLPKKWMKGLLALALAATFFYLHLLAARTGLLLLYVFLISFTIYLLTQKQHRIKGLLLIGGAIAAVIACYYLMPTFSERVGYMLYTVSEFKLGERTGDLSDIGRIISYDIALHSIRDSPMLGVGVGDLMGAMSMGYDLHYPHIPAVQRLIPHNQLLTIAMGAGLPALLFFILWLLQPFTEDKKGRAGFFFLAGWLMLFASLQTDAMLEVQYGVFVFLFFLCWFWHSFIRTQQINPTAKKS